MARRSYNQYCGLSRSLDLVGERWTLLVVRELMSGPKRYSDLAGALDGIGTSLLAARIKQLEQDGLIARRRLPPPAASQVYELTSAGRDLAAALVPLALWGLRHRFDEPRRPDENYRAEWTLVFLAAVLDPAAVADLRVKVQFRLEDSAAVLAVDHGAVTVLPGETDHPDAVITTDLSTVADLAARESTPDLAAIAERIAVDGNSTVVQHLFEALRPRSHRQGG
ncbi:transcriptional regulator [Nocardia terpenica]|uniref:winged helix-turn-helix transcriptional regulator n=1 Tax=Nocardia terpenica TaxID=455432 RepID=UPI0018943271|nr:winged helix-turn-helix transcriptional regulator [Nocardia terpenica]MBF6063907.1 transcriptional regulator [Nocardia terpenica]MBF6107857.1 transcriptional regulator [Nocardia terpenica]MBF6114925.1 transcriptional regulator [Nocardia terpenica]MBF6121088.1 transcriptional regulator [Nocardia terpenica]MBF6153370.1 transcriptional regulator [Nocardia terpenica]